MVFVNAFNYPRLLRAALLTLLVFAANEKLAAQSSDVMFPTPVRQPVIDGVIQPRPVGDSRLTTLYFTLDSDRGDLFINIKTQNFTGDVDLYLASGLKSLTKIIIYTDSAERETGRVIYLRKPDRLILRIEGRAIGDDPAAFQIKFAGAFLASTLPDVPEMPRVPKAVLAESLASGIQKEPERSRNGADRSEKRSESTDAKKELRNTDLIEPEPASASATNDAMQNRITPAEPQKTVEVIVSDPLSEKVSSDEKKKEEPMRERPASTNPPVSDEVASGRNATSTARPRRKENRTRAEKNEASGVDPLSSVRLIIRFRDASVIERPLSEILRFSVERGILTVVMRNGTIGRYSMLDVASVTLE